MMIKGELLDTVSSNAFQTSLPVCLLSAITHAPGLPPAKRIKRFPSIKGDPRQLGRPVRRSASEGGFSFPIHLRSSHRTGEFLQAVRRTALSQFVREVFCVVIG